MHVLQQTEVLMINDIHLVFSLQVVPFFGHLRTTYFPLRPHQPVDFTVEHQIGKIHVSIPDTRYTVGYLCSVIALQKMASAISTVGFLLFIFT